MRYRFPTGRLWVETRSNNDSVVDGRIVLRPPLPARVFTSLFAVVWLGLLGVGFVSGLRSGTSGFILVPLLMMVYGGIIISSNLRMHAIAESDEIRVVNFIRERRFCRSSVVRFVDHTRGGMPMALGGMIAMLLDDGRMVDLRATRHGPFGRSCRDHDLKHLQVWLES